MSVSSPPMTHPSRVKPFVLGVVFALIVVTIVVAIVDRQPDEMSDHVGSGVAASQPRLVPAFTALDLAGSNILTVRVGAPQHVVVHADDNLLDRVTTTVHSGTLVIDTDGSFQTNAPMRVDINVPNLTDVALSGSGTIAVDGVGADAFTIDLSGSGVVHVAGTTRTLRASIGGSGSIGAAQLTATGPRPPSPARAPSRSPRPERSPPRSPAAAASRATATRRT